MWSQTQQAQVHDSVLQSWITDGVRETALEEMLRLEGWRGQERDRCPACPAGRNGIPSVRCDDCWTDEVVCPQCCVTRHHHNPLHRVKVRFSWPLLYDSSLNSYRNGTARTSSEQRCSRWVSSSSLGILQANAAYTLLQRLEALLSSTPTAYTPPLCYSVNVTFLIALGHGTSSYFDRNFFLPQCRTQRRAAVSARWSSFICLRYRVK